MSNHFSFIPVVMLLATMMIPANAFSQTSIAGVEREADKYFEAGEFRNALRLYRQGGLDHSKNKKIRLKLGISFYEINDVDSAIRIFQSLINEGKTETPVFLYIAKCYQTKNLFQDAITSYKKYLQKTTDDDPLRSWVKDELTRCANGARLKYADQVAYTENAGTSINTQYAEFGAKNSPTTIDKIYFNSNRGSSSESAMSSNVDIYGASLVNGRWTAPEPLPSHINSAAYDEVSGFSTDGQIIYYQTIERDKPKILTDTFSAEDGQLYKGVFSGPFQPENGTDISFFNDSICLFASAMAGGYGGFDLYISMFSGNTWSTPANLGPVINSFYDERFPFLTRDGLTLFYSSDNLESVGGFDIFQSVFDPEALAWSLPENLGFPVNSSLDDTHIVLSPDGMTAFITSDRKEGHGESDLYRVYFKQPVQAHQQISRVPTFYQTMLIKGTNEASSEIPDRPLEIKEYFLSHLFMEGDGEVLAPQNTKKLDLLANLLLIYPQIKAELSCFELPTGQRSFNLYFSIKNAEKAAGYLERKGVPRNRLMLKGYGSSFPLATNPTGMESSPVFLRLNHRLEIGLHNYENEPVITHLENIPVPDNLKDSRGQKFTSLRHGMYYSVQIASITQILQNSSLETVEEMFIEVDNAQGNYIYMVGMSPTYREAEKVLAQMVEYGFPDAFIVPYVDGIRINRDEIPGIALEYPDLLFYLAKTNKK